MRHAIAGNRLGRNMSLRQATLRDLAKAALIHERICTTQAKAKQARKLVEKLISLGKKGTLAARRRAFAILCDHQLVKILFKETAPRFKNRLGGYTRLISLGNRRGDNAHLVFLELTEKKEIVVTKAKSEAIAKKGDLKTIPAKTIVQEAVLSKEETKTVQKSPVSVEPEIKDKQQSKEVKEASTKDALKETKKTPIPFEKKVQPKGIMGGFKRMFHRKTGE